MFANSHIHANSGSELIDCFFSYWVVLSCSLAYPVIFFFLYPVIFHQMTDIVHFISSGAGYLCNPINSLEVCLGTRLSSLEIVWSFVVSLLIVCQEWSRAPSNCSPLLGHGSSVCIIQSLWVRRFSRLAGRNKNYSQPCVSPLFSLIHCAGSVSRLR